MVAGHEVSSTLSDRPSAAHSSRRVLVASPVYTGSRRFLRAFLEAWGQISHPYVRFCIVENSTPDASLHKWLSARAYVRRPGDLRLERVEGSEDGTWGPLTRALNKIREIFLEGDFEFLLLNETSRPCPPDIVERLISYDLAVIGVLYKSTYHPGQFCVYDFDPTSRTHAREQYAWIEKISEPHRVGGIGFGAILIHRSVLERVIFRSAEYAADSYFSADLKSLQIPVYAAPVIIPNLKVDGRRAKLREWEAARRGLFENALTGSPAVCSEDRALHSSTARSSAAGMARWDEDVRLAVQEINAVVPPGDPFVLADQDQWRAKGAFADRHPTPLMERQGEYWGPPPDDDAAIHQLRQSRARGVRFVVFGWPAFWWLDHYGRLRRYLRSQSRVVLHNDRVVIFALRPPRKELGRGRSQGGG